VGSLFAGQTGYRESEEVVVLDVLSKEQAAERRRMHVIIKTDLQSQPSRPDVRQEQTRRDKNEEEVNDGVCHC